ncbi:SIS domain-containing protein [Domibacillus indicus]|uniref:SIS domain-containing protein n=1 Tax=Domibacillus indicus TaxID=1437523 RepID=UPI000617F90F|nr:SIS domain-containing protein [Domibacillus indicus]
MYLQYVRQAADMLVETAQKQTKKADIAAEWISGCVQKGGIIHVFGCGHSHMLAEELFYRAGGLACIRPILVEELMLHKGAVRSSMLERQNGRLAPYIEELDIRPEDVLIVVSTSGINPVPVDVALHGQKAGAKTIAITSEAYAKNARSRHTKKIKLHEAAGLVIDNGAPYGDALFTPEQCPAPFSPVSTVMGAALLNGIMASAIEKMMKSGFTPPVFLSGNRPDADEYNQSLIRQYQKRIPLLS